MNKWEYIKENYIDKGLKIFPVAPNGKTPLIDKWQENCSCDYMQVLYWYTQQPDCNWGLPCTPNNIFVLDLDVHDENKNGVDNFGKICDKIFTDNDYDNDIQCVQMTPSGGEHHIFKTDDELKNVSNGANVFKDYQGIDIRTDGYILVSPSEINGKRYSFETIGGCVPQTMHRKLKKFVIENAGLKTEKKQTEYKKPTSVDVGDRDNQLFGYINNLYFNTKLDYDEILTLALYFNENVFDTPFNEKKVVYKVKKAFDKDRPEFIIMKFSS